jgi:CobQ/CobB/MinD/ParA nucleotide binding domain
MKTHLNIILNGKGGVGKSFFATNFVQYLKDQQIEHCAIDTDNENSTLKRFHRGAEFINIANVQEIDRIFASLEKRAVVVVDCRAASTDIFLDYFAEVRVFEILELLNASLTVISPVNHEADSVAQVKIIAETLNGRCRYVVVKNQAHSDHFKIYEQSKLRARLMEELGGREIVMPKLYDWLVTALNEANLPITEAIKHPEISLVDRQRLKNWQALFNEQIEQVREVLLPGLEKVKGTGKRAKAKTEEATAEQPAS